MKVACYIDPERPGKTRDVMTDFAAGCGGIVVKEPGLVENARAHAIMGNWRGARHLVPMIQSSGKPFYHIDNGWLRQGPEGLYYRVTKGGMAPQFLPNQSFGRAKQFEVSIKPWRTGGSHILVCLSSDYFGRPFGIDQKEWLTQTLEKVKGVTDRAIVIRDKPKVHKQASLKDDLDGAWCLVTHSSGAAVKAALMGVPVFCEPTCGAAMVGCQDYSQIERPLRPDNRREWIASLVWQQWSRSEMRSGMAWKNLVMI